MKMMKSFLLGSAAGLVAATAGQAADLPVKAKPVEYVKICTLYGAGFYYMPGTDMCIKIGGWVRAEVSWGINGNSSTGTFGSYYGNRYTNNLWTRERGYITADAREQTAYGVARGYIAVGISTQNQGNENPASQTFSAYRAFVQWAGFTAGETVSFYDFYGLGALMYRSYVLPTGDTSDTGWWVWAYTAQFGGGFSATLSAEERRDSQIIGFSGAAGALGGPTTPGTNGTILGNTTNTAGYGGWQSPDVVANLRVDQAWGSAQVMGALHDVNAGYYGTTPVTGHPGDTWGWVVGGGIKINTPFISPGDYFLGEANYTQGAVRYLWYGNLDGNAYLGSGATESWGVGSDCVFGGTLAAGNATGCELTTAWGFNVGYEHYWTPQWHESFFVNGIWNKYDGAANAMLCVGEGLGAGAGSTAVAHAGCNNNWDVWGVGSRLQWDVTKSFYIGVEAIYQNLDSAQTGLAGNALTPAITLTNSGATTWANNTNWVFTLRMHKDFLP
jgi:hypothetical protein